MVHGSGSVAVGEDVGVGEAAVVVGFAGVSHSGLFGFAFECAMKEWQQRVQCAVAAAVGAHHHHVETKVAHTVEQSSRFAVHQIALRPHSQHWQTAQCCAGSQSLIVVVVSVRVVGLVWYVAVGAVAGAVGSRVMLYEFRYPSAEMSVGFGVTAVEHQQQPVHVAVECRSRESILLVAAHIEQLHERHTR